MNLKDGWLTYTAVHGEFTIVIDNFLMVITLFQKCRLLRWRFLVGVFEENPDSYSWLVFFVSSTRNVPFLCINAHLPTFTICT